MTRCRILVFFAALTLMLLSAVVSVDVINKDLINKKIERNIDIASQLIKIQTKITLENAGKAAAKSFLYTIERSLKANLCFLGATVILCIYIRQ